MRRCLAGIFSICVPWIDHAGLECSAYRQVAEMMIKAYANILHQRLI